MSNLTPLSADNYDNKIEQTLPYYSQFYAQIASLIHALNFSEASWLDTGCGTGELVFKAAKNFPNYQFFLCDPSEEMLKIAKEKLSSYSNITSFELIGSQYLSYKENFDIITAIQCHHYLSKDLRALATEKCFNALKPNGIYITFENFAPDSEAAKELTLNRWGNYQLQHGKSEEAVNQHLARYNQSYFPITIEEHLNLLRKTGFRTVAILWVSYMQVGLYAIK